MVLLYGAFVVKNEHGISGLLKKTHHFFFMECVNISIVNRNERKGVSVSFMHRWGKRLSAGSAGFFIIWALAAVICKRGLARRVPSRIAESVDRM